jgi:hypothetical protein
MGLRVQASMLPVALLCQLPSRRPRVRELPRIASFPELVACTEFVEVKGRPQDYRNPCTEPVACAVSTKVK